MRIIILNVTSYTIRETSEKLNLVELSKAKYLDIKLN